MGHMLFVFVWEGRFHPMLRDHLGVLRLPRTSEYISSLHYLLSLSGSATNSRIWQAHKKLSLLSLLSAGCTDTTTTNQPSASLFKETLSQRTQEVPRYQSSPLGVLARRADGDFSNGV